MNMSFGIYGELDLLEGKLSVLGSIPNHQSF
jgi:hypothetical protein